MRIPLLTGVKCTPDRGEVIEIDPGKFLDELGIKANGTPSLECVDEEAKKRGAGFVLAQYRPGATSKEQVDLDPGSGTELLCYDVDTQTRAEVDAEWATWQQYDLAIYSTWKHTPEAPRFRLVVRLTRSVPHSGGEFERVYAAVAQLLGIKFDPSTKDRARFFFGPQHKPGRVGDSWRFRFYGKRIDVDAMLASGAAVVVAAAPVSSAVLLRVPKEKVLRDLSTRMLRSPVPEAVSVGSVLEAVLDGRPYAVQGNIHLAGRDLAFALIRDVPLFDGEAFAEKYLVACWHQMDGAVDDERLRNWNAQVESARSKVERNRVDIVTQQTSLYPVPAAAPMGELDVAAARALGGALVCEHRGSYYLWNVRRRRYEGPIRATGLSAACREGLQGLPGFEFMTPASQGRGYVLKSGPQLVTEYGYTLSEVVYWAHPPTVAFDAAAMAIHIDAYRWNAVAAMEHAIVDELLRAMAGPEQYERLRKWLAKFPDLRQALPALVLVGPKGVWKTVFARLLAGFWGNGTPCEASQVLNKFSEPLLHNPVIHHDEKLAMTEMGRPMPETIRSSITGYTHQIEGKNVAVVTLFTATRHIMSVNHVDQVFGNEIDAASAEATAERHLVIHVDGARVAAFEARWGAYAAMLELRDGKSLVEHVAWLAAVSEDVGTCRLWVDTGTELELALNARFSDEALTICLTIAIEALIAETRASNPGDTNRLPLVRDEKGCMRLSPSRIVELWADSKIATGSSVRKPTAAKVGRMLEKAGFKMDPKARAANSRRWKAWEVNTDTLKQFLHVEGSRTWEEVERACDEIAFKPLTE